MKTTTWDCNDITGKSYEDKVLDAKNGIVLSIVNNKGGESDYVNNSSSEFLHWNGTSSGSIRYAKFTAPKRGAVKVYFKSNNSSSLDRIVAIANSVITGKDISVLQKTSGVYAAGLTDGSTTKTITGIVPAGGDVYIYNANGGCNISKIEYYTQPSVTFSALNVTNTVTNSSASLKVYDVASNREITSEDLVDYGTKLRFVTDKDATGEFKFRMWKVQKGSNAATDYYTSYQSTDVEYNDPVTDDFIINALFFKYYNFNIKSGGSGSVTSTYTDGSVTDAPLTATTKIWDGNTVNAVATPITGYRFKKWSIVVKNNAGTEIFSNASKVFTGETNSTLNLSSLAQSTFESIRLKAGTEEAYNVEITALFEKDVDEVGSSNKNSVFNTDFSSKAYELVKGQEYTLTFRNEGTTGENFYNWLMYVCTDNNHANDIYVQRADDYGWYDKLNGQPKNTADNHSIKVIENGDVGNVNWTTFQSDMQDAYVELRVAFDDNGKRLHIYSRTTTKSGRVYCMTETTRELSNSAMDKLYLIMSVEKAHITELEGSAIDASKVSYDLQDADKGRASVTLTNAEGIELVNNTFVGNGVNINYTANPGTGYIFDHWIDRNGVTVSNANPYIAHIDADVLLIPVFEAEKTHVEFTTSFNLNFLDAAATNATTVSDWTSDLTLHSNNTACEHVSDNKCIVNGEVKWDGLGSNSDGKAATEKEGEVYWKLTNNSSSIKLRIDDSNPFYAGDVVKVKMLSTETVAKVTIGKHNVSEDVTKDTPIEVEYTLTPEDVNSDGSITIMRNGSSATRYHSVSVLVKRYHIQTISNNNTYGTAEFTIAEETDKRTDRNVSHSALIHFIASVKSGAPANTVFESWTLNGDVVSTNAQFDATAGTGILERDAKLVANFGVAAKVNVVAKDASGKVLGATAATFSITDAAGNALAGNTLLMPSTSVTVSASNIGFGYVFEGWYVNGTYKSKDLTYNYGVLDGVDTEIEARFSIDSSGKVWDFSDKNKMPAGPIYTENGAEWTKVIDKETLKGYNPGVDTYVYACSNTSGLQISELAGLMFRGSLRVGKNGQAGSIILWNEKDNVPHSGGVKIPVLKGQVVTIKMSSSADRTKQFPGTDRVLSIVKASTDYVVVANEDGWIDMFNNLPNGTTLAIDKITIDNNLTHLAFDDCANGGTVLCSQGVNNYANPIVGIMPTNATVTWSSSNTSLVEVNPQTGVINVKSAIPAAQSVMITATIDAPAPFGQKTMSYYLMNGALHFDEPVVELTVDDNNSATYWQPVHSGASNVGNCTEPSSEIEYSIVPGYTAESAAISSDEDGTNSVVSITGLTGSGNGDGVIVKATSGAVSATYKIITKGFAFKDIASAIYTFPNERTYTKAIDISESVTYEIVEKYGDIKDYAGITIGASTGVISGLPTYDENKGGAIVVKASATISNESKSTYYTLTIPYKKHTWQFYREDGSGNSPLSYGVLVEGNINDDGNPVGVEGRFNIPGSAETAATGDTYTDDKTECYNFNREVFFDGDMWNDVDKPNYTGQQTKIRKYVEWKRNQLLPEHDKKYDHWNLIYKTMRSTLHMTSGLTDVNGDPAELNRYHYNYFNEPLFSYRRTVAGDNARIVSTTAGLVFNAPANMFGVNDNAKSDTKATREQDRSILFKGAKTREGSAKLTIPFVKQGEYVRLLWYRHSDNAGDQFQVTNAKDLDGSDINPNDVLRFTGSAYYSEYKGCTFLVAKNDGPMTINIANPNWTELYQIDVTDKFNTHLTVNAVDVVDSPIGRNPDGTPTGEPWTWGGSTENGNVKWLDDHAISVIRKKGSNTVYTKDDLCEAGCTDYQKKNPVDNIAKLTSQNIGDNPLIYIYSYPGASYTWNGWNLAVECKPVAEDADNVSCGLIQDAWTHVGHRTDYRVTALTNFKGTGTMRVIIRTQSGDAVYTLDKQEAYFPVGEYVDQTYPYTWDFSKYNMEGPKNDNGNYTTEYMHSSRTSSYGGWSYADNTFKMKTKETIDPSEDNISLANGNEKKYSKWLFANGSQLTTNVSSDAGASPFREADGLRFKLNRATDAMASADQNDIKFNYAYEAPAAPLRAYLPVNDDLYNDGGYARNRAGSYTPYGTGDSSLGLVGGTVITVPNVDHDMYIFVRSSVKPASVKYAVDGEDVPHKNDASAENNMHTYRDTHKTTGGPAYVDVHMVKGDELSDVYIYKVEKGTATDKYDIDITVDDNTKLTAIGVTKEFKNAPNADGWMTDSRTEHRIDYNNTGVFTKHQLKAYKAVYLNVGEDENGRVQLTEVPVVPSAAEYDLSNRRGLLVSDQAYFDKTITERRMIPLFVPACNINNSDMSGDLLIGSLDEEIPIEPSTETDFRYGLTNKYWNGAETVKDDAYDNVVEDYNFYITHTGGTLRANSAYLECSPGTEGTPLSRVRKIYMYFDYNPNEMDGIESPIVDVNIHKQGFYNLNGTKINGIPTKAGIYILNGRKVYVK